MAHKTSRTAVIPTMTIRGAYFYVHEKRTKDSTGTEIPEADRKHEFVGLIPKLNADPSQCANYRIFSDLAMQAVQGQEEWRGNWPAGGNWPIKDGDQKAAKYPWQAGCWVINFSTNYQPKVAILQNGVPTEIPARRIGSQDLYKSGDYCIVSTYAFTYDNRVRGVKFDIEGLLFVAPGEAIGTTSRSVDQMFGSVAIPQGGAPMPPTNPAIAPAPAIPTTISAPMAPPPPSPAPVAPQAPQYAPPPSPISGAPGHAVGYSPAATAPAPMSAPPVVPSPTTYPSSAPAAPAYAPPPMPPAAPGAPGLPPFPGR